MTPGTLIADRYRIAHLLGRGGMGAVYKVIDLQTDRARAIKLMLDHKVEDPAARERFRLEAWVAGRIDSPFIVDVHEQTLILWPGCSAITRHPQFRTPGDSFTG